MYYLINPDTEPNYLEIKTNFNNIKNSELNDDVITDYNILISLDFNSHSKADFFVEREKYKDKIINIFVIKKDNIKKIIGPIFINDSQIIKDIMQYINYFISCENVYKNKEEVEEELKKEVPNLYPNIIYL